MPGSLPPVAYPGPRLHIHGIKEMPAGYDAEVAELFRDLRAASGLSEAELANRIQTRVEVVQALEQGALYALPPWAETYRVVDAYGTLLNLDVRPLLRRIYAQLEAGIVELKPKPIPDVPVMAPAQPTDYQLGIGLRPSMPAGNSGLSPAVPNPAPDRRAPQPQPGSPQAQAPQGRRPQQVNGPDAAQNYSSQGETQQSRGGQQPSFPAPPARAGQPASPQANWSPPASPQPDEHLKAAARGEEPAKPRPARGLLKWGVAALVLSGLVFGLWSWLAKPSLLGPATPSHSSKTANPATPACVPGDPCSRKADKLPTPNSF